MSKIYLEEQRNKTNTWSQNPSSTNYPTEALVKGSFNEVDRINAIQQREIDILKEALEETTTIEYPDNTYQKGTVPNSVCKFAKINNIIGVSQKFNQLIENGNFASTSGWNTSNGTLSVSNNTLSQQTLDKTGFAGETYHDVAIVVGHKYIVLISIKTPTNNSIRLRRPFVSNAVNTTANTWVTTGIIGETQNETSVSIQINTTANGEIYQYKNIMCVDLTAMYGSGNEPSTVAQFLADHPEYNSYVEYNAGSVNSATITKVMSVGKNIWDEEWEVGSISTTTGENEVYSGTMRSKNYIPVSPNTTYYFKCSVTATGTFPFFMYDDNKAFINYFGQYVNETFTTPANCRYIRFRSTGGYGATYRNDIQVCLNSQPSKTTYHPYVGDELALPETITVRSAGTVHDTYTPITGVIDEVMDKTKLKDLNFTFNAGNVFTVFNMGKKKGLTNFLCSCYQTSSQSYWGELEDKCIIGDGNTDGFIAIKDTSYSDATAFKNHFTDDDVLVFEKITPTTRQVTPINPFIQCEAGGEISLVHTESPATESRFTVEYANKQ